MQISTNNNIGALVADDYGTANVFRNFGID